MRKDLPLQHQHSMLAQMVHHLPALPLASGKWVMSYKASAHLHEMPVHLLEDALIHLGYQPKFCYPQTNMDNRSMEAIADDDRAVWVENTMGIKEPIKGNIVPPAYIGLVIVPLLCFDKQGYRVGYGKGFYDRFLKRCNSQIATVGFSWFAPEDNIDDIDANDVPLKYCITPHQLYVF